MPAKNLQRDIITYWVEIATGLGFPRSVGEIYGLLFVAEEPLSADDLVEQLGISRSGAGQGIRTLVEIGALRPAHVLGSRKEHFQLQTDLGVLVKQLLNARILPRLEELSRQRQTLAAAVAKNGPAHLNQRFQKLERWHGKASPVIKLLKAFA
ncbi:MAG: transcriptional regulator [Verrucomicrobiota bacterium]